MLDRSACILIPAYNPGEELSELLKALRQHALMNQIYIVNDGPSNAVIGSLAQAGFTVLHHSYNRGKGAALRTGLESLRSEKQYTTVICMDADGQHSPEDIPSLINSFKKQQCDLLIGARPLSLKRMPIHRWISNRLTSFLVSKRVQMSLPDSQSGFRIINLTKEPFPQILTNGYEAETEFILEAAKLSWRISHAPIALIYNSSPSHMTHWRTIWGFLKVYLRT